MLSVVDYSRADPCDVREETLQLILNVVAATDGRGGGYEMDILRLAIEGKQDAPKEERDLCGRCSDKRMCLVQNDPLQFPLGLLDYRLVLGTRQHVFEHRDVCHEYGWRTFPKLLTVDLLLGGGSV